MGKKLQGAALRAKKRQKALVEELQEQQADQVAKQSIVDQNDQELFVIDNTGANVPQNQKPVKKLHKKDKTTKWSESEQKQIDCLLKKHSKQELASMVQKGQPLANQKQKIHLRTHGIRKDKKQQTNPFDLWQTVKHDNDNDETAPALASANTNNDLIKGRIAAGTSRPLVGLTQDPDVMVKNKSARVGKATGVALDVAKGGQSYRPDLKEHQKVLRQALDLEQLRDLAEAEKNAPISPGMTEATKALLLGDSDTSTSDSENEEEEDEQDGIKMTHAFHKQKEKLTKAQRNRQKRRRQEERQRVNAKKIRTMENTVFQVRRLNKELAGQEQSHQDRAKEREQRAKEKELAARLQGANINHALFLKDPIAAPALPVALTADLKKPNATLRTMIPKGDLVTDRMASYALRSLVPRLPAETAALKAKEARRRGTRPKRKVKGAKDFQGHDFVILK